MTFPKPDEYNAAVQNPKVCFSDDDLRTGKVQENTMGLPFAYSGGFTTTYKVFTDNTTYAARCFIRDVRNLVARYSAISDFRLRSKCPYLVDADVLKNGILVNGKWHPVIKMRWVEGDLLNAYIEKLLTRDQLDLEEFLTKFEAFSHQLEKDEFAHGDLQHGNIIIKNDKIYLIDYDGIYLPEIELFGTGEVGHPNYQHPARTIKNFDRNLDRFSTIVIWLSLKSLVHKRDLWKKYNNGENLLFRKDDFQSPEDSELFYQLSQIPELAEDIQKFAAVCGGEFIKIPSLQSFIDGNFSYTKLALKKPAKTEVKTISSKEHDVFNKLYGAASQEGIKAASGTFHYSPTTTLSGDAEIKSNSTSGFHAKLQAKMAARPAPIAQPQADNTMVNWVVWLMKKSLLLLVIIIIIYAILVIATSSSDVSSAQSQVPQVLSPQNPAVRDFSCPVTKIRSPKTQSCISRNEYCIEVNGTGSIWDGNFCTPPKDLTEKTFLGLYNGSGLVRSCPSFNCKVVKYGAICPSTEVLSKQGDWYKVRFTERGVYDDTLAKPTCDDGSGAGHGRLLPEASWVTIEGWMPESTIPPNVRNMVGDLASPTSSKLQIAPKVDLDQVCKNGYKNSAWTGEVTNLGNTVCNCPTSYQWNETKTQCELISTAPHHAFGVATGNRIITMSPTPTPAPQNIYYSPDGLELNSLLFENMDNVEMIAPNGANLRACQSTTCEIIETYPANTTFTVVGIYGDKDAWYKVKTPSIKSSTERSYFWVKKETLRYKLPNDVVTSGDSSVVSEVLSITRTSDSPSGIVVGTANSVTLAKFSVHTSGESLRVESLRVSHSSSDPAWQRIRNGVLFLNGVQIGSTVSICERRAMCGTAGYSEYKLGTGMIIEPGRDYILEIRGDIYNGSFATPISAGITTSVNIEQGNSNVYGMTSHSYTANSAATGNKLTVAYGSLTLTKDDSYAGYDFKVPDVAFKIGEFKITTGPIEGVRLKSLELTLYDAGNSFANGFDFSDIYFVYGTKTTYVKAKGSNPMMWSIDEVVPANSTMKLSIYASFESTVSTPKTLRTSLVVGGEGQSTGAIISSASSGVLYGQTITIH